MVVYSVSYDMVRVRVSGLVLFNATLANGMIGLSVV